MATMKSCRDISKPFTEAELEELRSVIRSLPTYKDGVIETCDFPEFAQKVTTERTPEQVKAYAKYIDQSYGGKLAEEFLLEAAKVVHQSSLYARVLAERCNEDKDGFINQQEFSKIMELMVVHEPKLAGKSWAEFLVEADANHDGKVSIDECVEWIEQALSKPE